MKRILQALLVVSVVAVAAAAQAQVVTYYSPYTTYYTPMTTYYSPAAVYSPVVAPAYSYGYPVYYRRGLFGRVIVR